MNALLKFLKAYPFDSTSYFDSHITQLLKTDERKALENLRKLFQCVALRRTKSTVMDQLQLMPRSDKSQEVDFSPQERDLYEVLRRSLFYSFHSSGVGANKSGSNGNVLRTITGMRRFCDHGLDLLPQEIRMLLEGSTGEKEIAQALTTSRETCDSCNLQSSAGDPSNIVLTSFQCGHTLCSKCFPEQQALNQSCLLCFGTEVSQNSADNVKHGESEDLYHDYRPSSKVLALLENLSAERVADPVVKRYLDP